MNPLDTAAQSGRSASQASRGHGATGSTIGSVAPVGYEGPMTAGRKIKAYVALTKPRIIELLLVATVPTMIFAEQGMPNFWLILNTLIGGSLAAGAAGAFNCYIDRNEDRLMKRTARRPLVTGEVGDREALIFAWVLSAVAVAWLTFGVSVLCGVLGVVAIALYAVFYSIILKRRTAQNIVWGGIAGCMPVLIGWAAVRGTIDWPALVLFMFIFLWTPPHYWPLSMKYAEDYSRAGVPMLGAVDTARSVGAQVVLYAWATVICSLLLVPVGGAGWVYALIALASGGWFLYHCHTLHSMAQSGKATLKQAMFVFHGSIAYITFVFVGVALDPFVGGPIL
ncbi:heme o synthase [Kocuria gwangalliensis]|uniref:Protoheme IX farnesyltransferase n=2 Tax=Micrococcaceae TaxID=1268 RepID=A0ABP8WP84_9MICC